MLFLQLLLETVAKSSNTAKRSGEEIEACCRGFLAFQMNLAGSTPVLSKACSKLERIMKWNWSVNVSLLFEHRQNTIYKQREILMMTVQNRIIEQRVREQMKKKGSEMLRAGETLPSFVRIVLRVV